MVRYIPFFQGPRGTLSIYDSVLKEISYAGVCHLGCHQQFFYDSVQSNV